jgi:hypothetical protein
MMKKARRKIDAALKAKIALEALREQPATFPIKTDCPVVPPTGSTLATRLKLTAIRDQLDSLIDEAGRQELTIREALSLFCEREIARKDERRIEMSIRLARFPFARDPDGFDFTAQPSVNKKQIREIATGRSSPMPRW